MTGGFRNRLGLRNPWKREGLHQWRTSPDGVESGKRSNEAGTGPQRLTSKRAAELGRRSGEARRRKAQHPTDKLLEATYLHVLRDPDATPAQRLKAAALLEQTRADMRELAGSRDRYAGLEPGHPRGALLGQMMGTPTPPLNDELGGRTLRKPPERKLSDVPGEPSAPEISTSVNARLLSDAEDAAMFPNLHRPGPVSFFRSVNADYEEGF